MPIRKTTATEQNKIIFHSNLSDCNVELTYRNPTTKERTEYQNRAVIRKGNKTSFNIAEAQADSGFKILTGIREGDFEIPVQDHEGFKSGKIPKGESDYITISSDPDSKFFVSDWKEQVKACAEYLLIELGRRVFDNAAEEADEKN